MMNIGIGKFIDWAVDEKIKRRNLIPGQNNNNHLAK